MKTFAGRVAVITGAASGLGRALAGAFGAQGLKLVLADVDEAALASTASELHAQGYATVAQPTDVSQGESVERLARAALEAFGAVHVVCNNAGVAPLGVVWEATEQDWRWALGVNLWGVIHGVRVFTPMLLGQGDEGHIVNTASVAGLIAPPGMGVYNVTKHAVVALSETLHHDLAARGAKVRCSVVCPAFFASGIADSERTRPAELRSDRTKSDEDRALEAMLHKATESGRLSAEDIAARVLDAVRDERFYVLTHPKINGAIERRMRDILDGRAPSSPM
ncbi:MAG TPA: SDR family NAD(P)-dependent oxidoreductase [Burkholderiales bacterium]|nr:SDR family NAD(P)-dependent oxidoreductase [Burkholderiales bacterium]